MDAFHLHCIRGGYSKLHWSFFNFLGAVKKKKAEKLLTRQSPYMRTAHLADSKQC